MTRDLTRREGAKRRGNMALEAALFIPVLVLLIVGMVQFGKVTYVYYNLKKIVWAAGRQVAVQQGVNYCDVANDPAAQAAISFALNDANGTPIIAQLTSLNITAECAAADGVLSACVCEEGVRPRPAHVLVTIPDGYTVQVRIPFLNPIPVTLNPYALVPFGGVS
jgi:Flp pilus assembly protein TadG